MTLIRHIRVVPGRSRSRQRGASIVEAAVILVPLLAIFFALIDYGMALFLKNTMQFAVRQGVRYAVTSQVQNGLGQDDSIKAVVNQFSFGFLSYVAPGPPTTTCTGTACIAISYFHQETAVSATCAAPPCLNAVNGVGSNAAGNVVQVTAAGLTYKWIVPLLRTNTALTFSASSADIMEAQPNGIPAR